MNHIANLSNFTLSRLTTVSYHYEPISEYISLLDKLYKSSEGAPQKEVICRKFKEVLNRYLGGREQNEEHLQNILDLCKKGGFAKLEFLELSRRLYQLATKYINIDSVLESIFEELQNKINGDVAVLCRDISDWEQFKSNSNCLLLNNATPVYPKQLRKKYVNIPLIIIAPAYWLNELLSFPNSESTFIIQPQGLPKPNISRDIFDCTGGANLWTSKNIAPFVDTMEVLIPSPINYKKEFFEESDNSILLTEMAKYQSIVFTKEVKDALGNIEYLDTNRKYLTVNKDGGVGTNSFDEDDELNEFSYIVREIDYSKLSDDDVNSQLRTYMEAWKKPLRDYPHPFELSNVLKTFGARNAKNYNIRNWMRKDTIRPSDDNDFTSLLKFAQISKEEFPTYISLAKTIRSNCISIGQKKSEISRELVAKELRCKLQQNDKLPSILHIGTIKASILALE